MGRLGVASLALGLAAVLTGCTALTDFERFHAGAELELAPDDGGTAAVDGAGDSRADAGEVPGATDASQAHVDADASHAPELAPLTGAWLVDRTVRESDCDVPSFEGYTWTVNEDGAGHVTVSTNSPTVSVQTLSGTRTGLVLALNGTLVGNAGTNQVTMRLTLASDGETFQGEETSAPRCPTSRRVSGTRL